MLKQYLNQSQLQKLSPQQIQLVKLIQLPTSSLETRIQEELEANPALDESENNSDEFEEQPEQEKDEFELDDYINEYIEDDPISYKERDNNYATEIQSAPVVVEASIYEYLEEQLGLLDLTDKNLLIAKQLIGSIDEDGYLRRDAFSVMDDLMFSQNMLTEKEEIEAMIDVVHQLDPPGIGARDLQESLVLQLRGKSKDKSINAHNLDVAVKIVENYFNEFSKKHYEKLLKYLSIDEGELREAIRIITKLNPKPSIGFNTKSVQNFSIIPDFIIENRDGELELSLNSKNAPMLQVNDQYMDMLKSYQSQVKAKTKKAKKNQKEAVLFIKQKIDSARWFIDAIKQRQDTLYRSMYTIMQFQYDFLASGDRLKLKPMILKDVAEVTSLDISTISRVANSKYVQTEFGIFSLKSFFSESLVMDNGDEVSSLEIKNSLRSIITNESKKKPLSDEKLKIMLTEKGYNIARRTVAKYREQLNIPVARLRKEL